MKAKTRPYDSSKRQAQAQERRRFIIACAAELLGDASADEFRLEDVARAADTSVQTILRAFGSKDGLMLAALETAAPDEVDFSVFVDLESGDLERLVLALFTIYDKIGDLVIRMLAEEHRSSEFQTALEVGRQFHKGWVTKVFAPYIDKKPPEERAALFHALLAASDIYIWKILRRDESLSLEDAIAVVVLTLKALIKEQDQ